MKSIVFLIFIIISLNVISSKNLRNVFKGSRAHPPISNLKYIYDKRKTSPKYRVYTTNDGVQFIPLSFGPQGINKPNAPIKYSKNEYKA